MTLKKHVLLLFVGLLPFFSYTQETDEFRTRNVELLLRFKVIGFPFLKDRYTVSTASGGAEFRIRERFSVMGEYVYYNWDFKDTYISDSDNLEYTTHQNRSQYYTAMEYRYYPPKLNLPDENGKRGPKMYYALNHKFGHRKIESDAHFDLEKNDIKTLYATFNEFNLLLGYQTNDRFGFDVSCGLGWRIEKRNSTLYQGEFLPDVQTYSLKQRPSFVVRWCLFFNLTKD